MIFEMKLQPAPFEKIKSGKKTIELRLNDEKRSKIQSGDTIIFTQTQSGETLKTIVSALHRFENFKQLYDCLPLEKCGYEKGETASHEDMNKYYTAEQQRRYGVLGIEVVVEQ